MITEQDLLEAIAECQGQRNPNANTCIKLAAYQIILDHMQPEQEGYSFDPPPVRAVPEIQTYSSDTEFGRAIKGKTMEQILPVMEELMETIGVLQPKIYNAVIRKLME